MSLVDQYKVITVTHHNLNIDEIGNFYILKDQSNGIDPTIQKLKGQFDIGEIIYLETCNRVSYIFHGNKNIDEDFLSSFFKIVNPRLTSSIIDSINKFVSFYEGESAIKHVFELASSMDSLVVGEREIFGQFRSAYSKAKELEYTGDYMRLLEQATVNTAKQIYSETKIGEKPLSVVSLAFKALMERQPSKDGKVLLVGAGETNMLVGKFLKKYGFNNIEIYNRSLDNASELSNYLQAPAYHLNDLHNVKNFDILIVCTAANKHIINLPLYKKIVGSDKSSKLVIDLSVPRNVEEDLLDIFNIDYIDIESLKTIAERNLAFRKEELNKAQPIIQARLKVFLKNLQTRQIEKALSHLPNEVKAVKERAIHQVYKKRLSALEPEAQSLVMEMMDYMEKKCISAPIKLSLEYQT